MLNDADYKNTLRIWEYLRMDVPLSACSVAIGLGGFDIEVARYAARLYHQGLFPAIVFSGANSPETVHLYPAGEAKAFGEVAIEHGVPADSILIEPEATNTGQNIMLSRQLLQEAGVDVQSVLIICMPSMARRAYATCRKQWPEVEVRCTSAPLSIDDYITLIGDEKTVLNELVGDLQRVIEYPRFGFAIEQDVPDEVLDSYNHLVEAGYTSRMM